ncbi:hypothetical protein R6Q59_011108 [Mikania micrantha]
MDPRTPFSYSQLLNDDDVEQQNPQQQPSFPQFSPTQQHYQYSQPQPFPQFHQQGPSFPQFGQFPAMPQFSQPQPAFNAQQWQQFLQWQQYQKTAQMQQPQFQQTQKDVVESPSKVKATNKKKKPSKKVSENDEQPIKTSRQKWPKSDEVLLAQAMLHISENPITGNNQNRDAYWGKIEKYYNGSQPAIPRDAHNLRIKSRYRSGWSDEQCLDSCMLTIQPTRLLLISHTNMYGMLLKIMVSTTLQPMFMAFNPPKRTKTSNSGGYTSSASDANFGENLGFTISLEDVVQEDFEVQATQVAPTRPIGRDKAKAEAKAKLKGKARIESSEINMRKLKFMDEISSTNRAKFEEIDMFKYRIDKFYELEKKKVKVKKKKLLYIDTSRMNPYQLAEHDAMCKQIREKYNRDD